MIKKKEIKKISCSVQHGTQSGKVHFGCCITFPRHKSLYYKTTHVRSYIYFVYLFAGYEWTLLDPCYLPQPLNKAMLLTYYNFFCKLGVEDFLSVRQTDVVLQREKLVLEVFLF